MRGHCDLDRYHGNAEKWNIRSYSDFFSDGKNFYYALGAIKNVGFEAISNVIRERSNNGEYQNLSDFINRVNPKDINKLQLEGLVKAGAFDKLKKQMHEKARFVGILTADRNRSNGKS